ncbi:MAG: glycosyltransferase [Saprospiraceae bacterium]|nr:glycosyltransferase [Saprospiraceae bacterium]
MNTSEKVINVSVVIAVKNEQIYIESAIESVMNQVGLNHEIIVIDDNSDDNTFQIVQNIANSNRIIKLHRNPNPAK